MEIVAVAEAQTTLFISRGEGRHQTEELDVRTRRVRTIRGRSHDLAQTRQAIPGRLGALRVIDGRSSVIAARLRSRSLGAATHEGEVPTFRIEALHSGTTTVDLLVIQGRRIVNCLGLTRRLVSVGSTHQLQEVRTGRDVPTRRADTLRTFEGTEVSDKFSALELVTRTIRNLLCLYTESSGNIIQISVRSGRARRCGLAIRRIGIPNSGILDRIGGNGLSGRHISQRSESTTQ